MSVQYTTVQWNAHKKRYDALLLAGVALFLLAFVAVSSIVHPGDNAISPPILVIRATGVCAIVLLHIILAIGPLARLNSRFAPLLYNRRHMGVTMFLLALVHALASIGFYGGFGVRNPVSAMLAGYDSFASVSAFPFEILGFIALCILFLMAATSHDFWLKNLTPRVWKALHMSVYVAYALLILHVALGAMQSERSAIYPALLLLGAAVLATLHILAGVQEWRRDRAIDVATDGWVDACAAIEIPNGRACTVQLAGGQRIAVFRDGDGVSAISNVCAHQGGPLGEGKIVDGCVTCPWHGYQYKASDGQSPPPYTEKIPTYDVRVVDGRVKVNPTPHPPGTPVQPARIAARPLGGGPDGQTATER